jgi:hypothetical protein
MAAPGEGSYERMQQRDGGANGSPVGVVDHE